MLSSQANITLISKLLYSYACFPPEFYSLLGDYQKERRLTIWVQTICWTLHEMFLLCLLLWLIQQGKGYCLNFIVKKLS